MTGRECIRPENTKTYSPSILSKLKVFFERTRKPHEIVLMCSRADVLYDVAHVGSHIWAEQEFSLSGTIPHFKRTMTIANQNRVTKR